MLYKRKFLPELYQMKHRNNKEIDYSDKIFIKNLSSYIFNNKILGDFIRKIQVMVSVDFESVNILKNFRNFMVDKYKNVR